MKSRRLTIGLLCSSVLIIGVCLSLVGCEKGKVSYEHFGRVEGTVIDSLTRLPIDSAWISVTPDTSVKPITYTDSSGHYRFTDFSGKYRFHYCGKNGYVTKKSRVYEIKWKETTIIDFELVLLEE